MVKRFLLGALFAFFTFSIESEETKKAEADSSSRVFPGTDYTFAQKWFENIKSKHAAAGFDKATFLREKTSLTFENQGPAGQL